MRNLSRLPTSRRSDAEVLSPGVALIKIGCARSVVEAPEGENLVSNAQTALILFVSALIGSMSFGSDDYGVELERWRQERLRGLTAEDGWLTLVGLHWLQRGETLVGSDPSCDIVLPPSAPPRVGVLSLSASKIDLRIEPGVRVTRAGKSFEDGEVRSDSDGKPDVLAVGDLRLIVLKRGNRFALRVKDNRSEARASFAGLKWYPGDESLRIRGRFEPSPAPTRLVFDTIVGEPSSYESPGHVVFDYKGKAYKLQAALEGDHLWFVFRDGTSGRTTHPGARSLTAELPDSSGSVLLDFNKAVNLPCAYTPYATCPLAPRQNRLDVPITAGEMKYEPGRAP